MPQVCFYANLTALVEGAVAANGSTKALLLALSMHPDYYILNSSVGTLMLASRLTIDATGGLLRQPDGAGGGRGGRQRRHKALLLALSMHSDYYILNSSVGTSMLASRLTIDATGGLLRQPDGAGGGRGGRQRRHQGAAAGAQHGEQILRFLKFCGSTEAGKLTEASCATDGLLC